MTLLESYQDPRLPQTVRTTPAPAAKPNLSFNGNNCSTAKTKLILLSKPERALTSWREVLTISSWGFFLPSFLPSFLRC
jgi:hypothetical protein